MLRIDLTDHFNLEQTFECGQCFRWRKVENNCYAGIVDGVAAKITLDENEIRILSSLEDLRFWLDYLDLERDYKAIQKRLCNDEYVSKAIPFGRGIRLLKQPPWECLISFIISQNNNIPRIKKIIESMCSLYGDAVELCGDVYYTFPTPDKIIDADLSPIRSGFREKYIRDAACMVLNGGVDLESIYLMDDVCAGAQLKKIKGVGDKVSDCVLLFAYQRFSVFPTDVWIKRTVSKLYGVNEKIVNDFAVNRFGNDSGFAQQYLFYKARG